MAGRAVDPSRADGRMRLAGPVSARTAGCIPAGCAGRHIELSPLSRADPGRHSRRAGGHAPRPSMLIWAVGIYAVIQSIESYVIGPLILRHAVELPPA